jgi:hypothetical protein
MIFNIFLGLAMLATGLLMLKFWRNVYNFTGAIDFVERLVTAGTPAFIKIMGIALVVIGLGTIFGFWGWLTAPLVDGIKGLSGQNIN